MQNPQDNDIDSDESQDLNENELIAMNRHLRNRRSHRTNKMTAEMQSLYKDALMDTFFGRFEQASKKLKSHIALCPDHSESYHLLGTMYEELGQYRNAVEYFFMSAYLSSPNFEKWKKVGEMSYDLQMYNQSAYCYGRALKIENYNIELMTRRAQAFEHSHQTKKAISTYKKILSITFSLPILKQYAKLRFKRGQYKTARDILMEYQDHQNDAHLVYMICETFLKQEKFQNLLQYLGGFIQNQKTQQGDFTLDSLNLELTIFLYICLVKLSQQEYATLKATSVEVKNALIQNYEESYAKEYELLITYIKFNEGILKQFLAFLIQFQPHKTIENYLIYTEILKKENLCDLAIRLLKQALDTHKHSVQLTSQLNHIKIVSGNWKQTKRRQVFDFKKTIKNQPQNQEDIYYSDDDGDKIVEQGIFEEQKPQNARTKKKNPEKLLKAPIPQNNKKNSLQTEDPEIIKRLLINCNETLQSIVKYYNEQTSSMGSCFKQVEDCINFIVNLTAPQKQKADEENEGLFNKSYRRRRYFSSRQSHRQKIINSNIPTILLVLENIIEFMKSILKQQQFNKVKQLAQTLSKAYFFRWQNKCVELRKIKKSLFEIGLLSCMSLQKYQTAVYFVKYLVHKQPENSFYLLVVNYLIHNSSIKIGMSSLLGKYAARNSLPNNMKSITDNGIKSEQQKQPDQLFQDQEGSQILSYPRKMSNMSNFSDITRDNLKLNYLFGIEYMETGYFDLAISSFLKVINLCDGDIKKTIWLCLSSCFLQISSSRTCHSKMPNTNSATYCFWQYLNSSQEEVEKMFNKGRFFAQLRMNGKAIQIFKQILQKRVVNQEQTEIQQRSAYCLMCIYKEMEDWDKVNSITEKYFSLDDGNEDQLELQQFN